MREILFRGKRIDNGEWVCGSYIKANNHWHKHGVHEDWIATDIIQNGGYCNVRQRYAVDPSTAEQYTGLTDKNGKKIFEGDMFRMDEDDIAVVVFKEGCFRLEIHGLCGTYTESGFDECGGGYGVIECDPIDWYYFHSMEVIGNIHDNFELLEVSGEWK